MVGSIAEELKRPRKWFKKTVSGCVFACKIDVVDRIYALALVLMDEVNEAWHVFSRLLISLQPLYLRLGH